MELTPRLKSVYNLLASNCIMIDVGTDHCFLPIYALKQGKISRAYAADVRVGPLRNGEKNARLHGCDKQITTLLSDGLKALQPAQQQDVDTVVCAGMGGTLIQSIIEDAPFLKNPNKILILQPQKAIYELKEYLTAQGFAIEKEVLSVEGDKIYQCMQVRFCGRTAAQGNPFSLLCHDPLFETYAAAEHRKLTHQLNGMKQGGIPDPRHFAIVQKRLKDLEEYYEDQRTI